MSIWFLMIVAVIAFAFMTIVRKWHDYALLFTIAIGFAVNANIYNGATTPVMLGNIVFGIDSILYTGFMFTVIICAKEYGIRKAKILTSSTIAAILVSAFIEFFAVVSSSGYKTLYLTDLSGYIFSAIGTFLGVWAMLFVIEKLQAKNVNIYLNFIICVIISSLINTAIYYGCTQIVIGAIDNILYMLAGSYIGKFFSLILGTASYFVNTHYWIPNELKDKYPISKIKNENTQNINSEAVEIETKNDNC